MRTTQRIPQIQALRALAASLVLIYHADLLPGGYIGVDIFYVISGYLITGILLRELENTNSINFPSFYARRFKRLLPSSVVVIVFTGVMSWVFLPASMRQNIGKELIAASTYISNYLFAFWNNDYQNQGVTPSPFIHFWSLAVEEQFYLFWPIALFVLYKFGKKRGVFIGIASIGAVSFIFLLFLTQSSPIWSFYILPTRAWELALGGLLLVVPKKIFSRGQWSLIATVMIVFGAVQFNDRTAFPGTAAILPVLATSLLILSLDKWPPLISHIGENRVTQWLGEISYPLYLWHWPILVIPTICLSRSLNMWEIVGLLLLTTLLAGLTHTFVETPIRYRKWSNRKTFVITGFVTSALIALGLFIFATYSNSISIPGYGKYSLDEIKKLPAINVDGCNRKLGQVISPACTYGDIKASRTIILYGDSHAAQWFPALDKIGRENNFKIISLTKSTCPAAEVEKELIGIYRVKECQAFRDYAVERISKEKPLAVIMSGMQPFFEPYTKRDALTWWLNGESIALNRIKPHTKYAIYLSDTPLPQQDIPQCLAAGRGSKCDDSKPINPTVATGLLAIDPTPWLCGKDCPAVVDGIVAYRDKSHISHAMSEHLAPNLLASLRRLGVFND